MSLVDRLILRFIAVNALLFWFLYLYFYGGVLGFAVMTLISGAITAALSKDEPL